MRWEGGRGGGVEAEVSGRKGFAFRDLGIWGLGFRA